MDINMDMVENDKRLMFECALLPLYGCNILGGNVDLRIGDSVTLKIVESNASHPSCMQVVTKASSLHRDIIDAAQVVLGYVPQAEAMLLQAMFDMGWQSKIECVVAALPEDNQELIVAVYILKNTEQNILQIEVGRAVYLTPYSYRYFTQSLFEKGAVHFRWGGKRPWELCLPNVNETVFFIYLDEENHKAIIYLTRVFAKGDDCAQYVYNMEEMFAEDDCISYAVEKVGGPVTVDAQCVDFLNEESITDIQPDCPISAEATKKLMDCLTIQ